MTEPRAEVLTERCMDCAAEYPRWWAPTDLFLTVIGGHDGPSLLCIGCFHDRAEKMGLRLTWRPMLDDEAGPFIEADTAYAFASWQASRGRAGEQQSDWEVRCAQGHRTYRRIWSSEASPEFVDCWCGAPRRGRLLDEPDDQRAALEGAGYQRNGSLT